MPPESVEEWHRAWTRAQAAADLRLYALIDCAVSDKRIAGLLSDMPHEVQCLFGYPLDTPIAATTPKLAVIDDPTTSSLGHWLLRQAPISPVCTFLASSANLQSLTAHLRAHIDVELKDIDSMFLAVWDPAILGSLVGQHDDSTLHVPGPVLSPEQMAGLLAPISHWWYWDRDGYLHDAVPATLHATPPLSAATPFVLDGKQVDALVEASVPDHLLQHIRQNQPELLERVSGKDRYRFVCQQLARARSHGLVGTGDLVNYTCLALAYGESFDEAPSLSVLLRSVQAGALTFDAALDRVIEADLDAAAIPPGLL